MRDDLRRVATFTSGIAEMTRNRAEDFVRNWVRSGDVGRDNASAIVRDLVEWSAANGRELASFVRTEVATQLNSLGVATRSDVERIEERLERIEESLRHSAAKQSRGRKSTTKTTAGKKRAARKSTRSGGRARRSSGDGST